MNPYKRLPDTPEPMHYWSGDGVRIAGDSWGPTAGPLVILQHGGGQTRHAWKGTGEALGAAGYFVIALDARGHGDSDWAPDGAYGQDAMVRDLECIISALGGRRPVLVGASMGGGVSLIAVGEKHVDATGLVLVDVAPNIEAEGVKNIEVFMNQRPDGFDSLEQVAEAIAAYQPLRSRMRKLDGLVKNVRLGASGRFYWHWDPKFLNGVRNLVDRSHRLEKCAANLDVPALLVRGAMSDLLSEDGARAFLKLAPRAEYVNVAGAAHMVAGDRNDIFSHAVLDFLSRVVPVKGEPLQESHAIHPLRPGDGGPSDVP